MSDKIEEYLQSLIEGQKQQATRDDVILTEIAEIRKTVDRLHERLDSINETTIVHGQKIKVLGSEQCKQEEKCKGQHELIWTKMRERKKEAISESVNKVKIWVLTAILSGVGALATVLVTTFMKK